MWQFVRENPYLAALVALTVAVIGAITTLQLTQPKGVDVTLVTIIVGVAAAPISNLLAILNGQQHRGEQRQVVQELKQVPQDMKQAAEDIKKDVAETASALAQPKKLEIFGDVTTHAGKAGGT